MKYKPAPLFRSIHLGGGPKSIERQGRSIGIGCRIHLATFRLFSGILV